MSSSPTPADPRVTVVIATNRGGPFLAEAVDSVRAQTLPSWELVLVDDGAPADVAARLDHLVAGDARMRVQHQVNRGLSVSRNVGAALGRGEYLSYLDDDDVWHPDRLRLQVAALDAAPDALLCYSAAWTMDADGTRVDVPWLPTGLPREPYLQGEVDLPRIVTMTMRRAAVLAYGGFNPSFRYCEDDEFILRMMLHGELTSVPDELVGYRRHAGNASGTNPVLRQLTGERIRLLQLWAAEATGDRALIRAARVNLDRFRRRLADYSASEALAWARRGRLGRSATELARGLRFSPRGTARTIGAKVTTVLRRGGTTTAR
ncbi:MAG TPA: glycosyltransferase family A protein [Cellulomonas sp.]